MANDPAMEKTETEILFPEQEVDGITVHPWTFGQIAKLSPIFRLIASDLRESEIPVDELESRMSEVILIAGKYAPSIVAATINLPIAEVEQWPPEKGIKLLFTIISQNLEHIKNSFGLGIAKKVENPPEV
jgi:hypothetical protein